MGNSNGAILFPEEKSPIPSTILSIKYRYLPKGTYSPSGTKWVLSYLPNTLLSGEIKKALLKYSIFPSPF